MLCAFLARSFATNSAHVLRALCCASAFDLLLAVCLVSSSSRLTDSSVSDSAFNVGFLSVKGVIVNATGEDCGPAPGASSPTSETVDFEQPDSHPVVMLWNLLQVRR